MLTQHIALVPEDEGVNVSELARVSAALQRQMTRDLAPIWGVVATIDAFPYLEDVPVGYWPIVLTFCELGRQSGLHLDASGQPYAQIQVSKNWSLAASRVCLEMLINPLGNRMATGPSPRSGQGPVEFVVEVSGPCADARNAYAVNGVLVADFCTPTYFGAGAAQPGRYSFCDSLTAPLQVLPGGHLTWYDPVTGGYFQRSHFGDNPVDRQLGADGRSPAFVRELLNASAPLCTPSNRQPRETMEQRLEHARRASHVKAHRLRALLGARLEQDLAAADIVVTRDPEREKPTLRTRPHRLPAEVVEAEPESVDLAALEEPVAPAAAAARQAPPPLPATPQAQPLPAASQVQPSPAARTAFPSLAPIALADRDPDGSRSKMPLAFALAAAAVLSAIWIGRVTRGPESAQMPPRVSPQRAATALAPAVAKPIAAPISAMEAPEPPPAAPTAPAATPYRRKRALQRSGARVEQSLPPPLPPPAVEDLIGTRR